MGMDAMTDKKTEQDMQETLTWFRQEEDGATAIEYGLIAALVSVASITALSNAGEILIQLFLTVAATLTP